MIGKFHAFIESIHKCFQLDHSIAKETEVSRGKVIFLSCANERSGLGHQSDLTLEPLILISLYMGDFQRKIPRLLVLVPCGNLLEIKP
jgi:hypothetical protein